MHVFYVNQDVASDFETGLQALGGITNGPTGNGSIGQAAEAANEAITRVSALEKIVQALTETVTNKADTANVVAKDAVGEGLEMSGEQLTVKLDGASLTKSAAGLKITE